MGWVEVQQSVGMEDPSGSKGALLLVSLNACLSNNTMVIGEGVMAVCEGAMVVHEGVMVVSVGSMIICAGFLVECEGACGRS